jgi:hypothetical protein
MSIAKMNADVKIISFRVAIESGSRISTRQRGVDCR